MPICFQDAYRPGEWDMSNNYSSPKIVKELTKQFGTSREAFRVDMKFTHEIGEFIKKVKSAQKAAENSKLVFK